MPLFPKSQFQQQHPLSPKKLTKKMLGASVVGFFLSLVLAVIPGLIKLVTVINTDLDTSGKAGFMAFLTTLLTFFVIFYIAYLLLYRWYWKAYINRYFYNSENGFIAIKKGVFTPTEIHVQFQKIQDVYVDQDLMDRILGIYDVHISSATVSSGIEAHIDGVDKVTAENLKQFFLQMIHAGSIPGPTAPASFQASAGATSKKYIVPEKISTATFPISPKWTALGIFNGIFFGFGAVLFVLWACFIPDDETGTSFAQEAFGVSMQDSLPYLFIIFILVFAFNVVKTLVWKKNYRFELLPEYIYVHYGFINLQEQHIPYDRIQDVIVRQGFIGRIIGISTLFIQNAVGVQAATKKAKGISSSNGIGIPGQSPENARGLSEIVRNILTAARNQETGL